MMAFPPKISHCEIAEEDVKLGFDSLYDLDVT